mmetsp:Transcript_66280/g.156530  ORF Transcript_66280/g.156530 Transcript_66280/m.156530 type:complete len:156 (+) Transcript_66280:3-470(+)
MPSRTRLRHSKTARPVKQKPKKRARVQDETVAALWNPRKTMRQNYAALGLASTMEETTETASSKRPREIHTDYVEKAEVLAANPAPPRITVAPGEHEFASRCLAKHGENYVAMAKDTKLNIYQHTPAQIRKKIEKYLKLLDLKKTTSDGKDDGTD